MSKTRYVVYGMFVVLAVIAVSSGILLALRAESKRPCSIPILMYHEVGKTTNSPWCVPIETFCSQMAALRAQGYTTIMPSDISAHFDWGRPLPRKPVIITFDDGYLGNLTIAEPVLKENGFRAVIYLITAQVAETVSDRHQYEGKDCLVWPEVSAMQKRSVFAFGGHAHVHINLVAEPDPLQIAECQRQLKLHGIREPYSFCYPYGQYNQETAKAVKQAGFQTAVVCEDTVAVIGPATNLFTLPRVSIMGGSHKFRFLTKSADRNNKTLVCQIVHHGIPLEISARLLWSNGHEKQLWLPTREIGNGQFELQFTLSDDLCGDRNCSIEIWDKHRLFKLATIGQ